MILTEGVPEFAIVGHPNEGKSSVLSTLSEDDSVRVSPVPGETTECRTFPVTIDGHEIIRFIDTPGFQNPRRTLAWMRAYEGDEKEMVTEFIRTHSADPAFHDDCALLQPIDKGAGLIFVVDGSRPLRNIDRAEMEILRLTGSPRMAIINCKESEDTYLRDWQYEFRKHFNSVRLFNSNRATYSRRIALLESLKAIDQELEKVLETVIQAFVRDWRRRNEQTAYIMVTMLRECLSHRRTVSCPAGTDEKALQERLCADYRAFIGNKERKAHERIRRLFKHNIFNIRLSEQSILKEDLFSRKTWEFLGLTGRQLVIAGALSGAALAAGIDIAAGGASLGIFTLLGGAAGAAATAFKGKEMLSDRRIMGIRLDHQEIQVGPVVNIQLLYILIDRALLFYGHVINWSHGRRDYPEVSHRLTAVRDGGKQGFTSEWSRNELKVCNNFFSSINHGVAMQHLKAEEEMSGLILKKLQGISETGGPAH